MCPQLVSNKFFQDSSQHPLKAGLIAQYICSNIVYLNRAINRKQVTSQHRPPLLLTECVGLSYLFVDIGI